MAEPDSSKTLPTTSDLLASSDPSTVSMDLSSTDPSNGSMDPLTSATSTYTMDFESSTDPSSSTTDLGASAVSVDPFFTTGFSSSGSLDPSTVSSVSAKDLSASKTAPSTCSMDPCIGTTDPSTCSTDLSICTTDPSTCSMDPCIGTTDPSSCSTDLSICTTDPSTCSMDPSIGTMDPSTDTVAPFSPSKLAAFTSEALMSCDSKDSLEKIAQHNLLNLKTKEMVSVQSLWSEGDVVILFVRWFGCIMARYEALKLGQIKELLESNGIKVVIVGFYQKRYLEFLEKFWSGDLYLDASRNCYKDLQFKSYSYFSIMVATASAIFQDLLGKAEAMNIEYAVDGEGRQNGGLLVVKKKPEGNPELALLHIEKYPGHRVLNSGILKALGISKEKAMESISEESAGCLEYEEPELPPDLEKSFADLCDQVTEMAVVRSVVGAVPMDMLLQKY